MAGKKKATPVKVNINRKHIWPTGELGTVTLTNDSSVLNLTIDQAKSLAKVLINRLGIDDTPLEVKP